MANIGVISALANKFTTIYSDQFNHASIVDGCKLSGARIAIYRHNDLNHLDELIRMTTSGQKIIITETIFSMDGDRSDLRRIHDIARHHNVITIVDDSHGDFIYETGRSRFESYGLDQVDVHVSSLSKALGCFGGYVAASQEVIELLVNKSRPFIYSSGLPAHLCSAALAAIPIAKKGYLQERLSRNVAFFSSKVDKIGLGNDNSKSRIRSQIIPLIIGDEKKTMQFSKLLLSDGIFIKPIRYPTVQQGKARLRASITATLHKNQLKVALEKIESTGRKLNII